MKRIALFTAFSPSSGGGGTNLRSITPALAETHTICWLYTSAAKCQGFEAGWLGQPLVGRGSPVHDMLATASLLVGTRSRALDALIQRLLSVECDAYWIVSHNEGMRVAWDLARKASRPVHLTIQDDWAGALCARSVRYRLLAPLANRLSDKTIKAVSSLDVTSEGMRSYYKDRAGVESVVIHPVVAGKLPEPIRELAPKKLTVGHAGSVYALAEFIQFVGVVKEYANRVKCPVEIKMWGAPLAADQLPDHVRSVVSLLPTCPEAKLVEQLASCHFLYAMYPFEGRLRVFARTSLPTKLSTYVQAQRPILGHGPPESTLAAFLRDTSTGVMWCNAQSQDGERAINALMQLSIDRRQWERAQDLYYGEGNVQTMRRVLDKLAADGAARE
jgi:hypothetical protein